MGFFDFAKKATKGYDKVKTKEKMTYDELIEIMKEGKYPVGEPFITGTGIMRCIQFPPTGKYKIQIAVTGKTITVAKIYSGVGGLVEETVGDVVTDGWYGSLNNENMEQNEATWVVAAEIKRLLEAKGLAQ